MVRVITETAKNVGVEDINVEDLIVALLLYHCTTLHYKKKQKKRKAKMSNFLLLVHSDKQAEDGNTRKYSAATNEYNKQIKSRALLLHCVNTQNM